jgi:hypothetical protein
MDKTVLLENLLDILNKELTTSVAQYESSKFNSIDAPHRMESRYDTSGIEAAWLTDGLAGKIQEKRKLIAQVTNFSHNAVKITNKVAPGSVVEAVEKNTGTKHLYFLLPFSTGGYVLNHDGAEITIVGIGSPIGKQMLSKQLNDTFSTGVNNTVFQITGIY